MTTYTAYGCDYSDQHPTIAQLKAAGKTFVCRYLTETGIRKAITEPERDALWAADIQIVMLMETTSTMALSGAAGGRQIQAEARTAATRLGFPASRPIAYAMDANFTPAQMDAKVLPFFAAILAGEDGIYEQVGAYGGYSQVRDISTHHLAWLIMQTYAWSNGVWLPAAQIQQYQNHVELGTGDVDLCRATTTDYGGCTMPLVTEDFKNLLDFLCEPANAAALAGAMANADGVALAPRPPFENADYWPAKKGDPGNTTWTLAHQLRDADEFARGRVYTPPATRPKNAADQAVD